MSEIFTEHEEQLNQTQDTHSGEDSLLADNVLPAEDSEKTPVTPKTKLRKKKIIILGAILVAVVAVIVFLHQSEFERVKHKAVDIAGMVSGGKGYFTIDTYPDAYANMGYGSQHPLLKNMRENALEAIKYANEALGFNGSLYNRMLETSALMGRQSEENSRYKVSWTYHPDDGLEVTYEKK